MAGLLFFAINLYLMYVVIDCYHQWSPWKHKGSRGLSKGVSLQRTPMREDRFENYVQKKDKVS